MMKFRIMTENDIKAVSTLYIEYYKNHENGEWTEVTTAKRIRQILTREDSYCLLLEEDNIIFAFAMGYFEQYDDGFAYDLIEVVVASEKQNTGIGTLFMKELEARVKSKGAMLIQLQAVNDARHERFYDRLQYRTATNLILKSNWLLENV